MNPQSAWIAIASGTIGAGSLILPALAIALAYAHGRYVPIWLPDLGTVGAYTGRLLWVNGTPPLAALALALALSLVIALMAHRYVFARFVEQRDYLSPLLAGLGLSFVFQALASLLSSGLSERFPPNVLQRHWYIDWLGFSVHASDIAGLVLGFLLALILSTLLHSSDVGARVRAVIANRDWAQSLGIPIGRIDLVVVGTATVLAVSGACLFGNRFDLQPTMMFFPGLTGIAAAVTVGFFRPFLAVPVALALAVGETLVGLAPAFAHMQRAIPFVILVVVLVARARTTERLSVPQ